MKNKIVHFFAYVLLVFFAIAALWLLFKERSKNKRLAYDFSIAYNEGFRTFSYFKTKNGQLAQRNSVLELSSAELRSGIAEDILAHISNLYVKPSRVVTYSNMAMETDKHITSILKDSLIFDTVQYKRFTYQDKFYNVRGTIINDSINLKIHSVDSILQIIYKGHRYNSKGKKVPGICFWHPRRMEQVISSSNPDTKIKYAKTVIIHR